MARAGFPRPTPEGNSPAAELLFPSSACHLVDEAVMMVWEQAIYKEEGGMYAERA